MSRRPMTAAESAEFAKLYETWDKVIGQRKHHGDDFAYYATAAETASSPEHLQRIRRLQAKSLAWWKSTNADVEAANAACDAFEARMRNHDK